MSSFKLKDRVASYQEAAEQKMLNRLPVIISINGRGFAKGTELLDKPHCSKFEECILSTTLKLCTEIEGALFAYQHNDEIIIISRNDQTPETAPWYDNKYQKICSVTSSIATLHFNNCANAINLDMIGDSIFTSKVFVVPNIMEAINTMIYKQQFNFHSSIQNACFYELLKRHDKHTIKDMLSGLNVDEKIELLQQECEVNFNEYPHSFRRGSACYRVPKATEHGMKTKWFINTELPIFTKDQSFLSNIFKHGSDIFRAPNL